MLKGFCYGAQVSLTAQKLFFPPTYIGVSTKQTFTVKNDSRIPVEYDWKVPDKYKNEIRFMP